MQFCEVNDRWRQGPRAKRSCEACPSPHDLGLSVFTASSGLYVTPIFTPIIKVDLVTFLSVFRFKTTKNKLVGKQKKKKKAFDTEQMECIFHQSKQRQTIFGNPAAGYSIFGCCWEIRVADLSIQHISFRQRRAYFFNSQETI